jgi:hypothetical protein
MTRIQRTGASRSFRGLAATLLCLTMLSTPAAAQAPFMGTFTWSTALPVGETKNFIDNYSWLGFTFEGDWFIKPNVSAGLILGWQEIYQEDDLSSFEFPTGTATGRTYRHLMVIPMLARARYWAGAEQERTVYPFGGLGLGTYRIRQTVDFGILTTDDTHWHFGFAPEAGVLIGQRYGGTAVSFTLRYNYPLKAGDYLGGDKAAWSYWGFAIGIGATPR